MLWLSPVLVRGSLEDLHLHHSSLGSLALVAASHLNSMDAFVRERRATPVSLSLRWLQRSSGLNEGSRMKPDAVYHRSATFPACERQKQVGSCEYHSLRALLLAQIPSDLEEGRSLLLRRVCRNGHL